MNDREFDALLREMARTGRDPAPEGFDARLEEALEGLPVKKRYLRAVRNACVAAALCGMLAASALAASPGLRDMLANALGSFAPYTQAIEGEAVDQDIRVRVVSAMADSGKATVYAELTDLSGKGRLANVQRCGSFWLDVPECDRKKGLAMGIAGGHQVAYDEKTQTLLYAYEAQYGALPSASSTGKLTITQIAMKKKQVYVDSLDEKLLTDGYLKTRKLESGETVLLPGQTKNDWTNDEGVTLSSMGYTGDGRLHFLFGFPEDVNAAESFVSFVVSSKTDLERDVSYNQDMRNVSFTQDGKTYLDYSVNGVPANREDIEFVNTYLILAGSNPDIDGEWNIPVSIERVKETVSPLKGEANGVTLRELRLSPLAMIIETEPVDDGYGLADNAALAYFADGTKAKLEGGPSTVSDRFPVQFRWEFPEAVDDLNDIVGLSVGRWYLELENGKPGASRMLDEQPQVSVGAEAVDQDIRVRIVSVKADSVKATVCAEFTDLSGKGRLANAICSGVLNLDSGENDRGGITYQEKVSYDEETQTMRCAYEAQNILWTANTTGTLEIKKIAMPKDSGLAGIKGDWSIPVDIERVEETGSLTTGELCGVRLWELRISTLGVMIETYCPEEADGAGISTQPMWVYFADGTKTELEGQPTGCVPGQAVQNRWEFPEELEGMGAIDKIVGVSVGRWYIPVEYGIPGDGYWLTEEPRA